MQINCLLNALSLTCCDRLSWTHWCKENHQRQLQTTGHYTPSQPWSWYQRDVISQVNFCGWFEKKRKKLNKSETQKWGQTSWRSMQKSLIFATFWAVLEFKEGTFDRSAVSADRNSISASAVFNIDPRRKAKHRLLRKIYWAMIKARQNTGRQILRGNCRRTLILPFSNACILVALTWTDGPGTTSRMKRHQGVGAFDSACRDVTAPPRPDRYPGGVIVDQATKAHSLWHGSVRCLVSTKIQNTVSLLSMNNIEICLTTA